MKRRSIETRYWKDSYIQTLSPAGKLLFIYLITNEHINIIHTYELPDSYISLETGISINQIQSLKSKFQSDGKFLFKDGWIKIVNADKYQHYEGSLNEKAKENLTKIIPSHILGYFNTPIDRGIDTPQKVSNNQQPITNNQQSVINNNINNKEIVYNPPNLTEEDFIFVANKYNVSLDFVKFQYDKMVTWAESKPNNPRLRGRNWKMTLMTFVRDDALKFKQDYAKQASDVSI